MALPKETKKEVKMPLGVFEETAELRTVLLWGAPGAEAALGQLLPTTQSLFYDSFDVPRAREEFENAEGMLKKEGVEVILVKDLFAESINDKKADKTADGLILELRKLAEATYEKNKDKPILADLDEVRTWIKKAIETDVARYGENAAVIMNSALSLGHSLPLANVIYARDQSNLMGNAWVWSSMRRQIRQPEVSLYKGVLEHSGLVDTSLKVITVSSKDGRFEGGDGIVFKGNCYIGVGGRTNMNGVLEVADRILDQNMRLFIPLDKDRDIWEKNEMDAMHLDTIWMPCGENEVVACMPEVERRHIVEVVKNKKGDLEARNIGSFAKHLEVLGVNVIEIDKDEQVNFAPNFLNLGKNKIILSLPTSAGGLAAKLAKRGKNVYNANLLNITRGYGGLHCMSAPIRRG
ncbi:hypothetical protein HY502_04035 [Candidatus Woesebacteria bacterium]|nr:hypothetical protein [Candidatus Woesebacteria bacterium]